MHDDDTTTLAAGCTSALRGRRARAARVAAAAAAPARRSAGARRPAASLDAILKQVSTYDGGIESGRDVEAARLRLRAQGRCGRARGVRGEAAAVPEGTGDPVRARWPPAGSCA